MTFFRVQVNLKGADYMGRYYIEADDKEEAEKLAKDYYITQLMESTDFTIATEDFEIIYKKDRPAPGGSS